MQVLYAIDSGIGRITLANPPRNALTHPVFADPDELASFLGKPALKAVIVRGQGRHFCIGADLERLREQLADPQALADAVGRAKALLEVLAFAPVPVIALIRGSCVGAGLEIALACHFRFAARGAMFGFPETEHGLLPGLGGTVLSRDVVDRGAVVELILSGRLIGAAQAAERGLVDRVVSSARLDDEVLRFVRSLTEQRPASLVRAVMKAINNARRLPVDEALTEETAIFRQVAAQAASAMALDQPARAQPESGPPPSSDGLRGSSREGAG